MSAMTPRQARKMVRTKAKAEIGKIKAKQSATKQLIQEAGSTVKSVVASLSANKALDTYQAGKNREVNESLYKKSMKAYNDLINAIGSEGSSGQKGDQSTTEVGGSGSALGG